MNRLDDITATVRSLDPVTSYAGPASMRSRTDLAAILATDPTPHLSGRPSPLLPAKNRLGGPTRTTRRVVLIAGMAAAVTAGMVVMPSLTGGDHAFATWTAAPAGMSAQEQADAVANCRGMGAGQGQFGGQLATADPAIAERRGVWTMVILHGAEGFSALCITDDSAGLLTGGMTGSVGVPADYAPPASRELFATEVGMGTMSAGDISVVAGVAGADVVGVVYHSRTHGDVTATVNNETFALWFPGGELVNASSDGVKVEVTYRDGSTTTSRLTL